jgi:hypothetical protein
MVGNTSLRESGQTRNQWVSLMSKITWIAVALVLSACDPAGPTAQPILSSEIIAVSPISPSAGGDRISPALGAPLVPEAREPDLCNAIEFVPYLSQPASVLSSLAISRPYRVIEWRGIEAQDYDPNRVVFRLDQAGNIFNIDCG